MKKLAGLLFNLRSVHNVGSIFRTADAAGFARLYLAGTTPTPLTRLKSTDQRFVKVSLGAEKSVPWEKTDEPEALIIKLKKEGWFVVGLEQARNSIPYLRFRTKAEKILMVMGNERSGLPSGILKRCDEVMEIPMSGKKESLNVAVAFGIAAFYLRDTAML